MRHSLMRKMILAVAATSIVTTGCFGTFQMTRNLYEWNKKVGNGEKWTQEGVFLVFTILPVYEIAGFLDAVFINSVEFWTGKNPMLSSIKVTNKDGTKVAQTLRSDATGRTEIIEFTDTTGQVSTTTMFQPTGSSVVTTTTKYADGRIETKTMTRAEAVAAVTSVTHR